MLEPQNRSISKSPEYQCEYVSKQGEQCIYEKVDSRYCAKHRGQREKPKSRLYDLSKTEYLANLSDRSLDLSEARSVRVELGLTRAMLEKLINSVDGDKELMLYSGEIQSLVSKIESLARTAHAIDKELGELMTKEQAKQLAGTFLSVVTKAIGSDQTDTLLKIAEGLQEALDENKVG